MEIKTFGVPAFSMQADLSQAEHVESLFMLVDSLLSAADTKLFADNRDQRAPYDRGDTTLA